MNGLDKNNFATYFAFHIRRRNFSKHYPATDISAEQIWENSRGLLDPAVTRLIYVSTDERNVSFFAPLMKEYIVRFLHDYTNELHSGGGKVNRNHIGMIEQVICANAHTFIGTPYSTFTGYITRMRGNCLLLMPLAVSLVSVGYYRDGRYNRTYYDVPFAMHQYVRFGSCSLP